MSVSSSDVVKNGKKSFFSNSGEIMSPSSWLMLDDHLKRNGVGAKARELSLAGTSFGVLETTVFSALELSQAEPRCDFVLGTQPVLAYAPTNGQIYENLTLAETVDKLCD